MTTRHQFPRHTWAFTALAHLSIARKTRGGPGLAVGTALFALLAIACAQAQAPSTFPLFKFCGEGSEPVTTVGSSDPVKIRYSFATDTGTCYSVTATIDGKAVDGYLSSGAHSSIGSAHPAIVAFEQELRTHVPQIPVLPPPAPVAPAAPKAASQTASPEAAPKEPAQDPPPPLSFAGFRAVDIKGNRVDFSTMRTPNIVIYFWSAADKRAIKKAEPMESLYGMFHPRGVDVVGVASARNATQLRQVCSENEVVWPEILDSGGIASRYHVDPAKPYLLLDQSRKVIAAAGSPQELESILGPLTQRRRMNQ